MAKRKDTKPVQVLGRDPLEGVEWIDETGPEPSAVSGSEEREPKRKRITSGAELAAAPEPAGGWSPTEEAPPSVPLRGKGVWLLYSGDVDLAIEMALAIGATHIFYKTGDRGMFFVEAARRVHDRVREAGLVPFAWTFIYCDDPIAEAEVAVKSAQVGYEGLIFDIEDQAAGKHVAAATLGRRVLQAGVSPARLYYTSFPNIWQHLDIPYREMNGFCRGGFMPQCYPTFQRLPRTVIDKWAYEEHARWSGEWGDMPPLYPVLAAYKDEHATQRLSAQEFLEWAEALAAHIPSFFSIYRAGTTGRELWPILAALGESPVPAPPPAPEKAETHLPADVAPLLQPAGPLPVAPQPEESPPAPAPIYHVVTVNDTVWSICQRYRITRSQFWEWNSHLWDEQGLPHDALYMREGWRLRVG